MKRYFKFLLTLTTFSLLLTLMTVSCSRNETCTITEKDGVKYYSNRNKPANPNLKFVIDNKFEIGGLEQDTMVTFTGATDLEIDKDGNFYILDFAKQTVFKYDKNGRYLLKFCSRGNGPAEIDGANDIAIVGDSLVLTSPGQARMSMFDLNGNFGEHRTIIIPGLYYGAADTGINENEILGYFPTFKAEDDKVRIGNSFSIKDKSFKIKTLIHEIPTEYDPIDVENAKIIFMPFAYYTDNIFYAPNFPENYHIHWKNTKGDLLGVISKHNARIEYNPEEKKHYEDTAGFVWNGERIIPNCKLKSVMNGMYADKYNNILVWVSQKCATGVKHNPHIDVFKDGEFQNAIILDQLELVESHTPTDMKFDFKKDKFIVYDITENVFSVYDYHYEGI
ncbi:MAG: 6-bladed beta-propeller [Candidatus Delongbacteria bacterium]|nr:6-bladed beta-propeller [Candidatus Delongbacteria bacterium]